MSNQSINQGTNNLANTINNINSHSNNTSKSYGNTNGGFNNSSKFCKSLKNNNLVANGGLNKFRQSITELTSSKKESLKPVTRLDRMKNPKNNNLSRSLIKSQGLQLTPAKKSSSLARPVRVYDSSSSQPKRVITTSYSIQQQQNQLRKQSSHDHPNPLDYGYDEEEHVDDETTWPIKFRLEQMLELTLPQTKQKRKKKKTMMLMKQQQRAATHVCKDTEQLLEALRLNNVDQNYRYNVKRCSVM